MRVPLLHLPSLAATSRQIEPRDSFCVFLIFCHFSCIMKYSTIAPILQCEVT